MEMSAIIRAAVEIGFRNGFVTFGELNELLPASETGPDEIETFFLGSGETRTEVRDDSRASVGSAEVRRR